MAFETIAVEIDDHVCVIKLNRPDALNALNTQLLGELCTALEDADANDKVRCIVITGSDKAFAAGADGLPSSPTRGRLEMRLSAGPMPIR